MRFNKDTIFQLGKAFVTGVLDTALNGLAGSLIICVVFIYAGAEGSWFDISLSAFYISLVVLFSRDLVISILNSLVKLKHWLWLRKLSKVTPETK